MDFARLFPWNWFAKKPAPRQGLAIVRVPEEEQPLRPDSMDCVEYELDRLFDHAFSGFGFSAPHLQAAMEREPPRRHFRARADLSASAGAYRITAELPGMRERDIRLELRGGVLSIIAEKTPEGRAEDGGAAALRCELALPEDADPDAAKAAYEDGVLSISLPRRPAAQGVSLV